MLRKIHIDTFVAFVSGVDNHVLRVLLLLMAPRKQSWQVQMVVLEAVETSATKINNYSNIPRLLQEHRHWSTKHQLYLAWTNTMSVAS